MEKLVALVLVLLWMNHISYGVARGITISNMVFVSPFKELTIYLALYTAIAILRNTNDGGSLVCEMMHNKKHGRATDHVS